MYIINYKLYVEIHNSNKKLALKEEKKYVFCIIFLLPLRLYFVRSIKRGDKVLLIARWCYGVSLVIRTSSTHMFSPELRVDVNLILKLDTKYCESVVVYV